jgi:Family of unknown function (DUF6065)
MKLVAYVIDGQPFEIRPAPLERDWMDRTDERFAYRCLPLNIANAFGWEILCPETFSAVWDGGNALESIQINMSSDGAAPAVSHFGYGILTFHVLCLFCTEPGVELMAQGPINRPKDGISPLTGVIETEWAPYTFTMNWKFTRRGMPILFEKDEPFCHVFPVRCSELENVKPKIKPLSEAPELKEQYETWTGSRSKFMTDLEQPGSKARAEKWQKLYYRGLDAGSEPAKISEHRTRLRLRHFSK